MTTQELESRICQLIYNLAKPAFRGKASDWVEEFISFNEPGRVGKFSFHGREYLREPLNFYSDDSLTDMVMTFGTRTGKTTVMYAGSAFRLQQKARRILYVKPTTKGTAGAEGDSRTRFQPLLRATDCLRVLIPIHGMMRHNFKTAQQIFLNGSIVDWTGSNSVANLASNSMEDVNQDEIDKFNTTKRRDVNGKIVEADAVDLADERTMEFTYPKRVKASTPTLPNGRIWIELLKTDLRRRFVPCPLCNQKLSPDRMVILAWSKDFTTLPKTGLDGKDLPLAYVKWDDDAKRSDGTWDLNRVEKSAGYVCPHCEGKFDDEHKIWMDCHGEWRPTQKGALRTHGYHLPSMYSNHEQTKVGKLAIEFLEGLSSVEGPRNFINSKLAEAYSIQGITVDRAGIVGKHIEVTGQWLKILSVDYHQNAPYFWAVVRAWNGSDKTHGIEYRSFNQWSDLDDMQSEHKVIPQAVIIDTGYNQTEVLNNCANVGIESRCTLGESIQGALPECIGWSPCKAFGNKILWKDQVTGLHLPYRLRKDADPFPGTEAAKKMRIEILEFKSDVFEDMMENVRIGKSGLLWSISTEMDTDEYHRHMSGKKREYDRKDPKKYKWQTIQSGYPDHIRSCELMNFVLAFRLELISFEAVQVRTRKPLIQNEHESNLEEVGAASR